jgi:hypothetical protein
MIDEIETVEPGWWRVHADRHGHHVDVVAVTFGRGRIVTTTLDGLGYDRHWCYETVLAAILAAAVWDGAPGSDPDGWVKAHDGRRRWMNDQATGYCHCGTITDRAAGDPAPDECARCAIKGRQARED